MSEPIDPQKGVEFHFHKRGSSNKQSFKDQKEQFEELLESAILELDELSEEQKEYAKQLLSLVPLPNETVRAYCQTCVAIGLQLAHEFRPIINSQSDELESTYEHQLQLIIRLLYIAAIHYGVTAGISGLIEIWKQLDTQSALSHRIRHRLIEIAETPNLPLTPYQKRLNDEAKNKINPNIDNAISLRSTSLKIHLQSLLKQHVSHILATPILKAFKF